MRNGRLLGIVLVLQARGRATARALAAEFEVAERTIHRDVEQLSAAGVPIYAERGRDGGFRLRDGYRTQLTGLSREEAGAVFLPAIPEAVAALGRAEPHRNARRKVLAALGDDGRRGAEVALARVHVDPLAWFREPETTALLEIFVDAIFAERCVRAIYRRDGVDEACELAPLGLVLKAGIWYVVALRDGAPRVFRYARFVDVRPDDTAFARPAGFDLAAFWREAAARYEAGLFRETATIRVTGAGLRHLASFSGALNAAVGRAGAADDAGWVRLTIPIESYEQATAEMLRLGLDVEVLEPLALRSMLAATVAALGRRYAGAADDLP